MKDKIFTKSKILIGMVFFIGLLGFFISFTALSELALTSGVVNSNWLSVTFAIMVDFFIVVIGAAWLWAKINSQKYFGYMGLMILWTGISIVLNLYHAPPNIIAKFIAVLPPLMIFIAWHVGWGIVEAETKQAKKDEIPNNLNKQIEQLKEEVKQLTNKRNLLKQETEQLPQSRSQLTNEVKQLTQDIKQLTDQKSQVEQLRKQLTNEAKQLTQDVKQLADQKNTLQNFFNSLTNSRLESKTQRMKKLITALATMLNEPELNTTRDLKTLEEKLA